MARAPYSGGYWTRSYPRRRVVGMGLALAAAGAGIGAVACDGDGDDDEDVPAEGTTPTPGGTARYPLVGTNSGNPPTLFPYESLTYLAQHPAALHYSRLLKSVAGPGLAPTDMTQLDGDLAEALPEQPDPLTYVFRLREGMTFHDKSPLDGRAVTAQDVLASYGAFIETSQNAGGWSAIIDRAEAPDARTFQITLSEPFAPFLATHASSPDAFWFIPVETIDGGEAATDPVGTGPFVFREFESDVALRWDKNPSWHIAGQPSFDAVETSVSNDAQRIVAALAAGDFDWCHFESAFFPTVRDRVDPAGSFSFEAAGNLGGIYFNFDNAPFQDLRVRRALSMALDREGLLGLVDPTGRGDWHSHLPPALAPQYVSPRDTASFGPSARYFQRDLGEVRSLLDAAGYGDGLRFNLIANVDRYGDAFKQLWEGIQFSLSEAGIDVELVYQEYGAYVQSTFLGDIPEGAAAVGPFVGSPRDADNIFSTVYASTSARHNWGGQPIEEQAELDMLFARQRSILDASERAAFVADIQRTMAESMLVVPYVAPALFKYIQPWVLDMYPKAGYGWHTESIAQASFDGERAARG